MAVTFACRQSSGTVPSWSDLVKMMVKIGASSEAQSFKMRAGILSGPVAFLGLVFCKSFRTPSSSMWISSMSGKGVPDGLGT